MPNEPNNFPVTYMGHDLYGYMTTFLPVAHTQSRSLRRGEGRPDARPDPGLSHEGEAGGSEAGQRGSAYGFSRSRQGHRSRCRTGPRYADYANTHNYICGHNSVLSDKRLCWNASDPILNGDWDGMYVEYRHTWHGGFMGYSNADLPTVPRVTDRDRRG